MFFHVSMPVSSTEVMMLHYKYFKFCLIFKTAKSWLLCIPGSMSFPACFTQLTWESCVANADFWDVQIWNLGPSQSYKIPVIVTTRIPIKKFIFESRTTYCILIRNFLCVIHSHHPSEVSTRSPHLTASCRSVLQTEAIWQNETSFITG